MKATSYLTTRQQLFIVVFASTIVYCNSLVNGFVFDDDFQILANPWITQISYVSKIFSSQAWGFMPGKLTNYYRPMLHLIYMATYHLFGLKPWGFHLVSMLFHMGTTVLVFLVGKKLFQGKALEELPSYLYPPFIAAILFAVHPIHTEVVAWAAGIPDLSFTFFSLFSFYLYLASNGENQSHRMVLRIVSAVAFFFATLSKETALILPLMVVIYDYVVTRIKIGRRETVVRYAPYLVVSVVYLAIRIYALGGMTYVNEHAELNNYECIISTFPLIGQYFLTLLLPVNLCAVHEFNASRSFFDARVIVCLVLVLSIIIALGYSYRRAPIVFFSLSLMILPLIPALYIRAIPYPFAERYLYLPSVGFVLLVAYLVGQRAKNKAPLGKGMATALALVAGFYVAGTVLRNSVWKDNYSLWMDTVTKSPRLPLAHNELGVALIKKGMIAESINQFKDAVQIDQSLGYVHLNYGIALAELGRLDEAVSHFSEAMRINPNDEKARTLFEMATTQRK